MNGACLAVGRVLLHNGADRYRQSWCRSITSNRQCWCWSARRSSDRQRTPPTSRCLRPRYNPHKDAQLATRTRSVLWWRTCIGKNTIGKATWSRIKTYGACISRVAIDLQSHEQSHFLFLVKSRSLLGSGQEHFGFSTAIHLWWVSSSIFMDATKKYNMQLLLWGKQDIQERELQIKS